jgi:GDSL-like lipase/acylhydrolase family protein/salicyl acyltransferaes SsfX3-like protein
MQSTPITAELVRGALELEPTEHGLLPHRLPARARAQCGDPMLLNAESQPSGVRLVFETRATAVELDTLRTRTTYVGAPDRADGIYDLRVDGELVDQASVDGGNVIELDWTDGSTTTRPGPVGTVRFTGLPAQDKLVELWLPWDETTELVELRTDAPVTAVPPGRRRVWLHHGSSISQGSIAASPSTTWVALAAARGGVDLVNLGFAGSALLDPFTARAMRDTPADLISVKIGINLVNMDLMRRRALGPAVHGFLDTIREGHPDTPLLVVSPLLCPIQEDTPGPGAFDTEALAEGIVRFVATGDPDEVAAGRLTLRVIRDELAAVVEQRSAADPALSYLDGLSLYGEADHDELPLPDNLHPDAVTHRRIADRFAEATFGAGGPFSTGQDASSDSMTSSETS